MAIHIERREFIALIGGAAVAWPSTYFAAWEQPGLFTAELRAAFRSLRQPT